MSRAETCILYCDDDYLVVNKKYGMFTFGTSRNKESVLKNLSLLNEDEGKGWNILYKLYSQISGCVLICKNKIIKYNSYDNIFLTLVYGKIENVKNMKEKNYYYNEIKLYLKYLPESNIMITTNNYEDINKMKCLKYEVLNNNIYYQKHNFSLLKLYINACNSQYIKPLLYYSLHTCIVGDNEYINVHKKILQKKKNEKYIIKKEPYLLYNNNNNDHVPNILKSRKFLLKKLNKEKQGNELKLHLHCLNVTFQYQCNKIKSICAPVPSHFKDTLHILGAINIIKNMENIQILKNDNLMENQNQQNKMELLKNKNNNTYEKSIQIKKKHEHKKDEVKYYDNMQDKELFEKQNDNLLKDIYYNKEDDNNKPKINTHLNINETVDTYNHLNDDDMYVDRNTSKKKRLTKRRGILSKDFNKLSKRDAPIFFTDIA
ncbi:hypothetical protein PFHG_04885 [Plasmodium falciparum HB3]|uniref:Pseudouridine synthase RsuA/RluA-like domain-containing protein n=1 Tax=Plasmodium falciparum (isolate HB3) TaxID=137071 RepID=A0A0L7KJ91_PLAFX|nr:hypothetical protein PFHG_04885 [Plasmodium falciparum HB3]